MEEEATQPATQPLPGHNGVAPSGNDNYLAGVICLLHPSSPAAYALVERLYQEKPVHLLKFPDASPGHVLDAENPADDEDEEDLPTQLATPRQVCGEEGLDIALRSKPGPKDPDLGFVFGRNHHKCDVVIGERKGFRRISNVHFRIYQNPTGVLMLEDYSTNGTWVDSNKLGGTAAGEPAHKNGTTHALFAGSIISVARGSVDMLRFVVRIPNQSGSGLCPPGTPASPSPNGQPGVGIDPGPPSPSPIPPKIVTTPRTPHTNLAAIRRAPLPPLQAHQMHTSVNVHKDLGWNGGGIYKIEGIIGAGAFATVKRAVFRRTGEVFAVKVIQKRTVVSHTTSVRKEVEILEKLNHVSIYPVFILSYIHPASLFLSPLSPCINANSFILIA